MPGDYIAGFVDGEGCFALKFRRDIRHERKNKPIYFYWDIEFAIELRGDDVGILEKIRETLNCGRININKHGAARYAVNDINDLSDKIIPFFNKHPLYAKKRHDFLLWEEAAGLFKKNQRLKINRNPGERGFHKTNWDPKDLNKLKEIHEAMKQYKGGHKNWKWL